MGGGCETCLLQSSWQQERGKVGSRMEMVTSQRQTFSEQAKKYFQDYANTLLVPFPSISESLAAQVYVTTWFGKGIRMWKGKARRA